MSRRDFVRTLASAGYAIGMAQLLGVEDFLSVDDGEVPVATALVHDPDDPWHVEERTQAVPADWYASVMKAFELNERLARSEIAGYLGSAVVPGSYRDGTAELTVEVSANPTTIRNALEDLVDGISLSVQAIDDVESLEDDPNAAQPRFLDRVENDRVPGGVGCETETSVATLGPALYHPDSDLPFFPTAEHAFHGDIESRVLNLPTNRDGVIELGSVHSEYPVEDVVAVEPAGNFWPDSRIAAPSPIDVHGQFTRFGLADLVARDRPLEKVGALTGHTTGKIQGIDAVTCVTSDVCRRGQIRWGDESDLTDGDSGSVSYHPDPEAPDDGVLIAGFNNARTWWPGQSYVWGVSAYHLTERHGYHF
nr:hypothetical protein [Natrononativus amylolyticus]